MSNNHSLNSYLDKHDAQQDLSDYREEKKAEYNLLILSGEKLIINKQAFSFDDDVLQNMVVSGETLRLDLAEMNGTICPGEREQSIQVELDVLLESMTDAHITEIKD